MVDPGRAGGDRMVFSIDKIHEIHQQAIYLSLHRKRNEMLYGINPQYVARLDQIADPGGQLLSDLAAMNNVGALGESIPLERWLRNAAYATSTQPDKAKFFHDLAEEVMRVQKPTRTNSVAVLVLPPCGGCWWRAAATGGAEALASAFRGHINEVRADAGIPELTEGIFDRLARETPNLDFGSEIIDAANTILKVALSSSSDSSLIDADFESRHIDNAWSRVLLNAESKGARTLVALFLAIFLVGGPLSALADTNLRVLLDIRENAHA
jgi:Effector-associated domain 5